MELTGRLLLAGIAGALVLGAGVLGAGVLAAGGAGGADNTVEKQAEVENFVEIVENSVEAPVETLLETLPLTLETLPQAVFQDISTADAGYDAIRYVACYGYLQGGEEGFFQPRQAVDLATAATVLWRVAGEPPTTAEGDWYAGAMAWAAGEGIVTEPEDPRALLTREKLASLLARFASYQGVSVQSAGDLSMYPDGGAVTASDAAAVGWALEQGLFRTMVNGQIQPDMTVSRLQLAQMLVGLLGLTGDELAEEIFAALPAREAQTLPAADHDAIQAQVDEIARKYSAIGLQVAAVKNGQLADTWQYGWATKDQTAMTADHKLRSASISKVVVGLAAMLLREDGVISLDGSIGEHWGVTVQNPRYSDKPVSIRALLTHTSSIINAGDDVSRAYSSVLSKLQSGGYSDLVPGSPASWSYNNYAFGVLGMTLELASGQYVDDILRQKLFDRMGIDAAFSAGEIGDTTLLATVYRQGGSVGRSVEKQISILYRDSPGATGSPFAGGLTISAADLGKLAGLLASDGCYEGVQLLSAESVALMETTFPLSDGSLQGMPLRGRDGLYGRERIYYHTGSAYGVYNLFSYDPATGDGVVVLTSGASGAKDANGIYAVCSEISQYIYDLLER